MEPDRYLDLLAADGELLATAAAGALEAPVPACPGWTGRDVVLHTARVYQHKLACMRLAREPSESDYPREPAAGEPLTDWFRASLTELLHELRDRGPGAPSYTWYAPDQTVGFWYRRMAQETAVHRVDAESAAGAVTPTDPELALDGIDEMLGTFLDWDWSTISEEEWGDWDPATGLGTTVALRADGEVWRATTRDAAVEMARDDGAADATVEGDAQDVLLWLWGRAPLGEVRVTGDAAAITALRARLHLATQ